MYDVKQYRPGRMVLAAARGADGRPAGEGKAIVGRGAVNQKGPETAFLAALHAFKATGRKLPVNLVLVAEGEEEIGSPNFHQVIANPEVRAALSKAVGVFIPRRGQESNGAISHQPRRQGRDRTAADLQRREMGPRSPKDIHSSLMASVDSPAWRLVKALDTLVADDGHTPAIDGWFENVEAADRAAEGADRARASRTPTRPRSRSSWASSMDQGRGLPDQLLSAGAAADGQHPGAGQRLHGPGGKTILPGRAEAKLDLRLVPDMTKDEAVAKLKAHLAKRGFGDIEVNVSGGYGPTQTAEDSLLMQSQKATLEAAGDRIFAQPAARRQHGRA